MGDSMVVRKGGSGGKKDPILITELILKNQNYVVPNYARDNKFSVKIFGGGGRGSIGKGGGGGYMNNGEFTLTPGQAVPIMIGGGGISSGNLSNSGGTSTFGAYLSANGGSNDGSGGSGGGNGGGGFQFGGGGADTSCGLSGNGGIWGGGGGSKNCAAGIGGMYGGGGGGYGGDWGSSGDPSIAGGNGGIYGGGGGGGIFGRKESGGMNSKIAIGGIGGTYGGNGGKGNARALDSPITISSTDQYVLSLVNAECYGKIGTNTIGMKLEFEGPGSGGILNPAPRGSGLSSYMMFGGGSGGGGYGGIGGAGDLDYSTGGGEGKASGGGGGGYGGRGGNAGKASGGGGGGYGGNGGDAAMYGGGGGGGYGGRGGNNGGGGGGYMGNGGDERYGGGGGYGNGMIGGHRARVDKLPSGIAAGGSGASDRDSTTEQDATIGDGGQGICIIQYYI